MERIKKFGELIPMEDSIYWLDPKDGRPTESMVHSIEPYYKPGFKDYIQVNYFKQTSGIAIPHDKILLAGEHGDLDIYKSILVPFNASNVIAKSIPPTVVYTNLNELKKWMGLEKTQS